MGDVVTIETYVEYLARERARGTRFAFVTHNTHDFSDSAGRRVGLTHTWRS